MPLAMASSLLTLLEPSALRDRETVSTDLAHREQRRTSTRAWPKSIAKLRKVSCGEQAEEVESEEMEQVDARWAWLEVVGGCD